MARVCDCIVSQFSRPSGLLGAIAGGIMAHRPSNRERAFRTLELLDIQGDDSVLEVGFGPGIAVKRALELAPKGVVAGIDHSQVMLRQALRRNRRSVADGRADLRLGSVESLPDFGRRFDRIVAINSIAFWTSPSACLTNLRSRLAPEGRLALTFQPRNPRATTETTRRSADRLARWLDGAGFRDIQMELLNLRPVPAACVIGSR
jgi:cyclopropane fatty-acyl-phospholipid synthase-like methyltransferase